MKRYFHHELEDLRKHLILMGERTIDSVRLSMQSLLADDVSMAGQVIALDDEIDRLEVWQVGGLQARGPRAVTCDGEDPIAVQLVVEPPQKLQSSCAKLLAEPRPGGLGMASQTVSVDDDGRTADGFQLIEQRCRDRNLLRQRRQSAVEWRLKPGHSIHEGLVVNRRAHLIQDLARSHLRERQFEDRPRDG